MRESRSVARLVLAVVVLAPLGAAACDLLGNKKGDDAGPGVVATAVAPTATPTATETAAPVATAPVLLGHGPTRVLKLVDGGTVTVPAAGFDAAAFPSLSAFDAASVPPLAVPGFDASSIPKTLPTTLPSGFPTALPGWPPPAK